MLIVASDMPRNLDKPISDLGYTTKEVADRLKFCDKTLARMRARGDGPPFIQKGRRFYYPFDEYFIWVQQNFGEMKVSTIL